MCIKWDSVSSGKFTVSNGVKQGGILSPIFFIYVNTLSVSLNQPYTRRCLNRKATKNLCYVDYLPTATRMSELLLREYEQFSENIEIRFKEQKPFLLYLKLRIKPGISVMVNGTVIKMESS